jgi:hypothetical protein
MARSSSRRRGKLLLLGAAVAFAAFVFKRDKVAGLLPARAKTSEPPATPPRPGPSNYDAPGPVANTATPVPAPDAQQPAAVDEAAEEAAAAAEAANIGGTVSDYAGPADLPATEAERPLAEAGEGEAEGREQADLDLETAAQPTAPGVSDSERQIEDTIEQAANPLSGEQVEPVTPPAEPDPPASARWSPPVAPSGVRKTKPTPDEPAPFVPPQSTKSDKTGEHEDDGDDKDEAKDGAEWRTWSGRSINP